MVDGTTNSVTATIPVGTLTSGVAVDSETNFIYVANAGNSQNGDPGSITVIDGTKQTTDTLTDPKAKNPSAVAVNSTTNKIYVANSVSNNVTGPRLAGLQVGLLISAPEKTARSTSSSSKAVRSPQSDLSSRNCEKWPYFAAF